MTGSNHDDFTLVIAHICIVSMFGNKGAGRVV